MHTISETQAKTFFRTLADNINNGPDVGAFRQFALRMDKHDVRAFNLALQAMKQST